MFALEIATGKCSTLLTNRPWQLTDNNDEKSMDKYDQLSLGWHDFKRNYVIGLHNIT